MVQNHTSIAASVQKLFTFFIGPTQLGQTIVPKMWLITHSIPKNELQLLSEYLHLHLNRMEL